MYHQLIYSKYSKELIKTAYTEYKQDNKTVINYRKNPNLEKIRKSTGKILVKMGNYLQKDVIIQT